MSATAGLLVELLCLEQRRVDPAVVPMALDPWAVPDEQRPLVLAVAALGAGEPKRALRWLDRVPDGVAVEHTTALRHCAAAVDLNWYPGDSGAALSTGDIEELSRHGSTQEFMATPFGHLAALALPSLLSLRSSVSSGQAGPHSEQLSAALQWFAQNRPPAGSGCAAALHALAVADLSWRAGDLWRAQQELDAAVAAAASDPAAGAHAALVQGDWQAEPRSSPETLGLTLAGSTPPATATGPDLAAAGDLYLRAARGWTLAGSQGGVAATALRQAHVARLQGDAAGRDALRARSESLAVAAGARSLALLAQAHGVLDRVADGEAADPGWADRVAAWATADGSSSYARGLVRLLTARVTLWRADGSFMRARQGLRVAARLATQIGSEAEIDLVGSTLAQQYAAVHRPAAIVAADQRLAALLPGTDGAARLDTFTFLSAANEAMTAFQAASRGASSRLVAVAARRLRQVVERAPTLPELDQVQQQFVGAAGNALSSTLAQAELLRLWYLGLELRRAGHQDQAERSLSAALTGARQSGDALLEAAVLIALRRPDEALGAARALTAEGLSPDLAAALFLRLGSAPDAAHALALEGLSPRWLPPGSTWETVARDAELRLLRGECADAAWLAEEALRLFSERLARLGRDILRSASTDVPEVADAYHVAVLAHLGLAARAKEAGDPVTALSHELQSLRLIDSPRGLVLDVLDAVETVSDVHTRRTARAWLRAGSAWSAAYEDLARKLTLVEVTPAESRAVLVQAEHDLDAAEEELTRRAPTLVGDRGPATLDLAAAREGLPADAVVLGYHAHRDDLVMWAMTRSTHRLVRQRRNADDLTALAVRAHRCFSGQAGPGDTDQRLSEILLEPFAAELDGCRRVLLAPPGALALLPFHALPWRGRHLIDDHDVSYLPTVGLLSRRDAARRPRLEAGALLVGDPAVHPSRRLPRLPGTVTEVLAAAQALSVGDPLLGSAATEEAVSRLSPGRAVLHLAAHGLLEADAPNLSSVVLAGHDRLTVGDLMGLDLQADLVVLSACHTGQGTATAAGDVVGLTRAALATGARHVVVSLWPVDDQAGALVMAAFYRRLGSGEGVAQALAGAQRERKDRDAPGREADYRALAGRHGAPAETTAARGFADPVEAAPEGPYYWAPFVHVGV